MKEEYKNISRLDRTFPRLNLIKNQMKTVRLEEIYSKESFVFNQK